GCRERSSCGVRTVPANTALQCYVWITRFLGLSEPAAKPISRGWFGAEAPVRSPLADAWRQVSLQMRTASQRETGFADLESDFWLCKSADDEDGVLRPCWKPPESITDFYPPPHLSDHERWRSRATASAKFSELLQTLPSLTDAEISRRHQRAPCALAGD